MGRGWFTWSPNSDCPDRTCGEIECRACTGDEEREEHYEWEAMKRDTSLLPVSLRPMRADMAEHRRHGRDCDPSLLFRHVGHRHDRRET